jgi:Asp-tRNA(Asn)/Glu-tRNA(Gln) amidotransferase A subunit family amidase
MKEDELFYASATTLARRIRDRELSSEEVVRAHLQRIETINARLNAVVRSFKRRAIRLIQ